MPKITMTFNLPEEQPEHAAALHGGEWRNIVYALSIFLRNKLKYGHDYATADEVLEAAKAELWNECKGYNLDPWED